MKDVFSRYGQFAGGIDLPEETSETIDQPIASAPAPTRLRVPLAPCGQAGAQPIVEVGQDVQCGETLAVAAGLRDTDIHAPVAGRVAGFEQVQIRCGRDLMLSPAIEITDIHGTCELGQARETSDWRTASSRTIRDRLAEAHIATHRGRPEPLRQWIHRATRGGCEALIVNAMENQPYLTAEHRLLVEYGEEVMQGLAILALATEAQQVFLAVEGRRTREYADLIDPAIQYSVTRVALPHKYPIGADAILVKVLMRREIPIGGRPEDVHVSIIDPATCLAAYRWIACNQRLTGRVVTVNGEGISHPANIFAPFGMACRDLLGPTEAPMILGGPMVGRTVSDEAVITQACESLLALSPTPHAPPSQCIRCGWCRDHCPVRLNVSMLNDMYELGDIEQADRLGALACVGCGVCSYVCPARLPLTDRVRRLGRTIHQQRRSIPLYTRNRRATSEEADL
jgi:electron transport complex protein RnfC